MNQWNHGYVTEVDYTYGFYRETTPQLMCLAAALRGFAPPDLKNGFTYCELGFGQGFGANLLAAANPQGDFWGTDFNPQHAAGARELASAASLSNTHWFDDSFEEFLLRETPDFDFIVLHGIYSWISVANRRCVVEFIRRKLKLGGLVYVSYNTLPGWASSEPLRTLLQAFDVSAAGSGQPLAQRIDAAMDFAGQLAGLKVGYFGANPDIAKRLDRMRAQNRNYLAHEYLNADWHPQYFFEVVREMEAGKLSFVGSAYLLDHVDGVNFTPQIAEKINDVTDPILRETVRDYCLNTQFRRDLFTKGGRRMSVSERDAWLQRQQYVLQVPHQGLGNTIQSGAGEVRLQQEIYEPLVNILAEGVQSFEALLQKPELKMIGAARLMQALTVLTGAGRVLPLIPQTKNASAPIAALRFNAKVLEESGHADRFGFMASPVVGSGIALTRVSRLLLVAHAAGITDPAVMARRAWSSMKNVKQRVVRDGKPLESEEDNLSELTTMAEVFLKQELHVLRRLGVLGKI